MQVLRIGAWVHFGLAGLGFAVMLGYREPVFLAAAISAATVALLLIGLDRVVALLADILVTVRGEMPTDASRMSAAAVQDQPQVRTLAELEADLARLRGKG